MKILLAINLPLFPTYGGANKANRLLAEALTLKGHRVRAVAPAIEHPRRLTREQFIRKLMAHGFTVGSKEDVDVFSLNGVEVHAVAEPVNLRSTLLEQIDDFAPDCIVLSSEDSSQNLLDAAVKACPNRVIYIAHTPSFLPFGPQSFFPSAARVKLFEQGIVIVAVSEFIRRYIRQWSGLESYVIYMPVYGNGPFPQLGHFGRGFVTMVNPCQLKGISIFCALADQLPEVDFAAVPSWGTTPADFAALEMRPNIRLLEARPDFEEILRQTQVLLMPSLWQEAFGLTAVEAMLRGIPVLASNVGGLVEAKLGTSFLLPVCPIERFTEQLDENQIPLPIVPEQDIGPWRAALNRLISVPALYAHESQAARAASSEFAAKIGIETFEDLLSRTLMWSGKNNAHPSHHLAQRGPQGAESPNEDFTAVEDLTPAQRTLLTLRLRRKASNRDTEHSKAQSIQPIPRTGGMPLSFAQQRLWFFDRLGIDKALYNIPIRLRLMGRLNVAALEQALVELTRRHEGLRTIFTEIEGQPVQIITPLRLSTLSLVDLSGIHAPAREAVTRQISRSEAGRIFDLSRGPLLRSALLKLSSQDYIALFAMHHIISDGWSISVLVKDLSVIYKAFNDQVPSPLPELSIQYADYAAWQRQALQGEKLKTHLAYWTQQLADAPPELDLPRDRPRPPAQSFRGAYHHFSLPEDLSIALRFMSNQEGVSLFMCFLAAFQLLLYRLTREEDIVVGTDIANRNLIDIENVVGFFVNQLVLRTRLEGNISFYKLLSRVREVTLAAYAHQDLPFDKLVESLNPERTLSHSPIFQVKIDSNNNPGINLDLWNLKLTNWGEADIKAKLDLALLINESSRVIRCGVEYSADLFDSVTVQRISVQLQTLLRGVIDDPDESLSRIPLLTDVERRQLLGEYLNRWISPLKVSLLHESFERIASQATDAIALVLEDEQVSYGKLDQRANQLARYLRKLGLGPELVVGVCLERSTELVACLLAILKSGAAYLPLDPATPLARLIYMLADSRAYAVLTRSDVAERLQTLPIRIVCINEELDRISKESAQAPDTLSLSPKNLAYVIYTSGSTGEPKGVAVEHAAAAAHMAAIGQVFGISQSDSVMQFASTIFDVYLEQVFTALGAGARLALRGPLLWSPGELHDKIVELELNVVNLPTAYWSELTHQYSGRKPPLAPTTLRLMIVGGEAMTLEAVVRWQKGTMRDIRLLNAYGPTEATVTAMTFDVSEWKDGNNGLTMPIGRATMGRAAYVFDQWGEVMPIGIGGEVYLGGCLSRGYIGSVDLTAERFLPDQYGQRPGARLYWTGDKGKLLSDGTIAHLGRTDEQIKIRGFRIEPREVEAVIRRHAGVREAIVLVGEDENGDKRLIAYVVTSKDMEVRPFELRQLARDRLLDFMVPSTFIMLDKMPLTANGKVDRRALLELGQARGCDQQLGPFARPSAPLDELVAGVWTDVLSLPAVSPEDNFFDLGGHSLLATQIISRINTALGVELPLPSLFETPALGDFTRMVDRILSEQQGDGKAAPPILTRGARPARLPLSFAQQRLWFLEELWPGSAVYNTPVTVRLEGRLDIEALWRALQEVVRRHEALRTSFASEGGEARQITHERVEVELALIDLGGLGGDQRQRELRRLSEAGAAKPFSLNRWPLMRAQLVRVGEHEHALLLIIHHIVFDGWSLGVLGRELASLYESYSLGQEPRLEELPVQYADYAVWQREWLAGPLFERQLSYWRKRLEGAPEVQELVGAKRRPEKMGYRGEHELVRLGEELSEGLRRLGRKNGATLFMVLLGGFALLLSKYVGSRDVVVGTDVANRRAKDVEGLIGFFVNMLALRIRVEEEASFRELLDQAREVCLGAYDHQEMPFEKIVEELRVQRSLSHAPLFQVKIVLQNTPMTLVNAPGLSLSWIENSSAPAKLDLTLILSENPEGIRGILEYDINLYDSALISRFASDYNIVLQNVVKRPELTVMELNEILDEKQRRESNENKERRKESNLRRFRAIQPRAINIAGEELVKIERFDTKGQLPLVFKPNLESVDIVDWVKNNCHFVEEKLLKHGAILFRGFKVELTSEFEAFALALGDELFNENGEHPREVISGNVYTPVFYPADKRLLWHNENSFNNRWPMKIWFGCVKPAQIGGETTLVDSRKVFDLLAPQIRDEFIEKNVMYVRNYRKDLGLDWRTVFSTNERAMVEEYCLAAEMEFEWKANDQLMTRSVRPAVVQHPQTKEWVWFNQAQHWHVSCLDGVTRQSMLSLFDENDLPRNCYYGDGSPIEEEAMAAILETYRKLEVSFPWQNGDILLLHNLLTAHGRNPFVGERKLLVAMGSINSYNEVSSQSQKGA